MATRAVSDDPHDDAVRIPDCSICQGKMVLAYARYSQKVCVCTDCHTSITIPGSAWHVASLKREGRMVERSADRRQNARRAGDAGIKS